LIDDPQTDFQANENVTNEDDSGTRDTDASGSAATGPALAGWFTSDSTPTVTLEMTPMISTIMLPMNVMV
jgi:hypothetical protein